MEEVAHLSVQTAAVVPQVDREILAEQEAMEPTERQEPLEQQVHPDLPVLKLVDFLFRALKLRLE